jgi:hypothetical protein
LKQNQNWHTSNQKHFHHVLLSNHSQFLVIFKFFVHVVFHIANCFHPYHLTQNRSWRESKLTPSILYLCRQFLCRRIPRSSLAVHFHADVLSGMVCADTEFSEMRRVRESGWSDGLYWEARGRRLSPGQRFSWDCGREERKWESGWMELLI